MRIRWAPWICTTALAGVATAALATPLQAQGFVRKPRLPMPVEVESGWVELFDLEGDGDLDLLVMPWGTMRMYLNDGSGGFVDQTKARLPGDYWHQRGAVFRDFDRDGDLDFVSVFGGFQSGGQTRLFLNDGKGKFRDASATHMPKDLDYSETVAAGDVDKDGDLDLVIGSTPFKTPAIRNRLYLNDGQGKFRDVSATHMPIGKDPTTRVALADLDRDGDLDCIATCDVDTQNKIYFNNGKGVFRDATATHFPKDSDKTFGLTIADVDGDGDLDAVMANTGTQSRLYLNDGKGRFVDATTQRLPALVSTTFAVEAADVDNDGDQDLIFGIMDRGNRLFVNNGRGFFKESVGAIQPFRTPTYDLAVGDLDGDGDIDCVGGGGRVFLRTRTHIYINRHADLDAPIPAAIGKAWTLESRGQPGERLLLALSTRKRRVDLGPLGILRLDPSAALIDLRPPFGNSFLDRMQLSFPNDPKLRGLGLHWQGLRFGRNLLPRHVSNLVSEQLR